MSCAVTVMDATISLGIYRNPSELRSQAQLSHYQYSGGTPLWNVWCCILFVTFSSRRPFLLLLVLFLLVLHPPYSSCLCTWPMHLPMHLPMHSPMHSPMPMYSPMWTPFSQIHQSYPSVKSISQIHQSNPSDTHTRWLCAKQIDYVKSISPIYQSNSSVKSIS